MELNAVVLASLCLVGFTQGAAIDETAMLGKRHGPGEESSLTFNLLSKLFETVEEEIDETKNDLEETKTDLEETKTDLEETKTDLEETRTNLYNKIDGLSLTYDCTEHYTAFDYDGKGNMVFLDRHTVSCSTGRYLAYFRLQRKSDHKNVRYIYKCCKIKL